MQVLKEDVRKNILLAAKKEFLTMGFTSSSLRRIAKDSNVTLSNIYNYFENKDDLFRALLMPTIDIIKKYAISKDALNKIPLEIHMEMFNLKETIMEFTEHTNILYDNWTTFKLLFLCSHGSSLENIKETIINEITSYTLSILERLNNDINQHKKLSILIHNSSAFYINFYVELIMHNRSKEAALGEIEGLATFMYYGWKGVLDKIIMD